MSYNPLDMMSPLKMSEMCNGSDGDDPSDHHGGHKGTSGVTVNVNAVNNCGTSNDGGGNGNGDNGEDPPSDFAVALQASASQNQTFGSENTPTKVLIDTLDYSTGDIELADSKVAIGEAGTYMIIAAPQVGREARPTLSGGGKDPRNAEAKSFRCWIRVNGEDVPNSNVLLKVMPNIKDVIITQGVLGLEEGDEVEVYAAVDDDKILLEAIETGGEPLVPAIIFTIHKVN